MAYIRKRGKRWAIELYVQGNAEHATFATKAQAAHWALERTAELTGARLPDKTLGAALARYSEEVAPSLRSADWAAKKLKNLRAYPIARKRLASITAPDLAAWRDARLKQVSAATVNRELNLLSAVLHTARRDWGWLDKSPLSDVRRPPPTPSRKRRVSAGEVVTICRGLGYVTGAPANLSQRVALAFLFALETAMRGGEIVRLQWADVGELSVKIQMAKSGEGRDVPLSTRAREIIALMPRGLGGVFGINDAQRDSLFRKGRGSAGVAGVNFHDSRAEAIWRLSKRLDVFELARVTGHRNIQSLMLYYNASADELAAKLG